MLGKNKKPINNKKSKANNIIRAVWRKYVEILPVSASKILYYHAFHQKLNLKMPVTFNEKLMYLKIYEYTNNPLVRQCIDKYEVRKYVNEKGCGDLLNDLLGVWNSVEEIEWGKLPNQFVLKCNHGCKMNIICDNKELFDIDDAKIKLNKWMHQKFWNELAETNYKGISHKIICERYLSTSEGFLPNDYKIYCFNGKPRLVLVCTERSENLRLSFFDLDWKPLDIGTDSNDIGIMMPISFSQMLRASEKLAKDFPFVRVDFYQYRDRPVFGEMTFTPAACTAQYYNDEGNRLLGDLLVLPRQFTN